MQDRRPASCAVLARDDLEIMVEGGSVGNWQSFGRRGEAIDLQKKGLVEKVPSNFRQQGTRSTNHVTCRSARFASNGLAAHRLGVLAPVFRGKELQALPPCLPTEVSAKPPHPLWLHLHQRKIGVLRLHFTTARTALPLKTSHDHRIQLFFWYNSYRVATVIFTHCWSIFNDASVVIKVALEIVRGSLGAKQCLS